MKTNNLNISVYSGSFDFTLFINVINKGIDSRLTAFTKSKFKIEDNRLYMDFSEDEIEILIRRLLDKLEKVEASNIEDETEYYDILSWITDIVNEQYMVEIVL